MGTEQEETFSAEDAVRTQRAFRTILGLDEERFPLPAFIGMLSDEIEMLRSAGHTDLEVAELIAENTGRKVTAAEVARHYASAERRAR